MPKRLALLLAPLILTSYGSGGRSGSDGGNEGGGGTTPPTSNSPLHFTSAQTASVVENQIAAYQATALDPNGKPLIFTIDGGFDADLFSITPEGALRFKVAPDYDLPFKDYYNQYNVRLQVSNGSESVTQTVVITVTNSFEGISVERVGTGFNQPTFLLGIPGSNDVYVLERAGAVYRLTPSTGAKTLLFTIPDLSTDDGRGLLGMALLPSPNSNRFVVYCYNVAGDIELRQYAFTAPGSAPNLMSAFAIPHPNPLGRMGGAIAFGPDGLLYVGTGDGPAPDNPRSQAQNPNSQLGKILRIKVVAAPPASSAGDFFKPAPGNPYIGGGGDPYVYALGFRNPASANFYGSTLTIGDRGQTFYEELDLLTTTQPGANFGWPFKEGPDLLGGRNSPQPPADVIDPVFSYYHRTGVSITAGYVYRGPVTSLRDLYIMADDGTYWSTPASSLVPGQRIDRISSRNEDFQPDIGSIGGIAGFGEDSAGNLLFAAARTGEIFMIRQRQGS